MNCPRCATVNLDGSSLCAQCGTPLPLGASAGAAVPVQPPAAGYGAPPPGYGAPPPGYGPGYGAPPPGYGYPPPGYPQPYGYAPYPQTRTSGMAIAGFVISLVFCGILGLIFSIMGNNEVKRSNGTVTGGGLAIAGIVIGIIRLLIEILYIVLIAGLAADGKI
jgi:Domain of unknown function (DUF4190)